MTKVKICGITNLEDARAAVESGADLLGFVFYRKSPRYVPPERVSRIVADLRSFRGSFVGVFVNEDPKTVWRIASRCGLDVVQLHGTEPPQDVAGLAAGGLGVIKAFRVVDGASLAGLRRYQAMAYLLDTYVPGQLGGTGRRFDWTLVSRAKSQGAVILAGGLTPGNVAEAVRVARPWGVDVSSGVEGSPGRKDPDRLRRFIAAVRSSEELGL